MPRKIRKLRAGDPLFVIFEIRSGCECCAPGPRETTIPAGWNRGGMTLRELLAYPHRVRPAEVDILVHVRDEDLTRADLDALRARVLTSLAA